MSVINLERKNYYFYVGYRSEKLTFGVAPVLPIPAKCYLPDLLKNSAAGEKIRPNTLCSIEAGLIHVIKDSECMVIGKKSGNTVDFMVFFFNVSKIYVQTTLQKSPAPFLPFFFWQICRKFGREFSRPLTFFWGHFCVLRQKFRPVGNTASHQQEGKA
jgi:hypothetical protein